MYAYTHTAKLADLSLPAAAWGEKDGTFINSERRIGVVRKVSPPPGEALTDFNIIRFLAAAWGCGELFKKWTNPEAAFQLLKQCSAGQPCDFSGIESYAHLDSQGGIQWPLPKSTTAVGTERRLFEDRQFFTPDQRARFVFDPPRPLPEPVDPTYPFLLNTGRGSSAQWHTETRTSRSEILKKLHPAELLLDMNPADATLVCPGQVFLPMHDPQVNQLTHWAVDPHSRQPSYKAAAVQVTPHN
jgi:predicted molibdopterin-dependent oxidoreductase YjgC